MMGRKRYHVVAAKPRELRVAYGRADDASLDIQYAWGGNGAGKPDARCVSTAFEEAIIHDGMTLREVLVDRGYDITTLKFSVQLHDPEPQP